MRGLFKAGLMAALTVSCSAPAVQPDVVDDTEKPRTDVEEWGDEYKVRVVMNRRGDAEAIDVALPDGPIGPGDFCSSYANVVCRKLFACAEPDSLVADAVAQGFHDEPSCVERITRFCGAFVLVGVEQSVEQGRVQWDAHGFAACFAHWRQDGCRGNLGDTPDIPVCRQSSIGTVGVGGVCTSAFDCREIDGGEVACGFDESGKQGVCFRFLDEGAPCEFTTQCRSDLRCREDRCQPPGGRGGACLFDEDCREGLRCTGDRCQ